MEKYFAMTPPRNVATSPRKFLLPYPKNAPTTLPIPSQQQLSLVQFQLSCLTFLHLNIYACLPIESPVCSFTLVSDGLAAYLEMRQALMAENVSERYS